MADRGKEGSRKDGEKMHRKSNEYWFKGPGEMQACYSILIRSTFPWSLFEILVSNPPFIFKEYLSGPVQRAGSLELQQSNRIWRGKV